MVAFNDNHCKSQQVFDVFSRVNTFSEVPNIYHSSQFPNAPQETPYDQKLKWFQNHLLRVCINRHFLMDSIFHNLPAHNDDPYFYGY